MQDNDRTTQHEPRMMMRVEDDSYCILVHMWGEKMQLVDVLPCPVLGFLVGPDGLESVVSLRGTAAIKDVPIWGPEGCVHRGNDIFPDYDSYVAWVKKGGVQ